eukprot:gene4025-4305_t
MELKEEGHDHLGTLESETNLNRNVVVSVSVSPPIQTKPLSRFQQTLKNPFYVLLISFVLAWIYAILPDGDYWIYYCIKNQYWAVMSLIECSEMMTINIPDVKDTSYFLSYLIGFFVPLLIHLIAYYQGSSIRNNIYLTSLSCMSGVVVNWIVYGVDCFLYPDVQSTRFKNAPKATVFSNGQQAILIRPSDPSNPNGFTLSEVATLTSRLDIVTSARNKYRSMFMAIGEGFTQRTRSTLLSTSSSTSSEGSNGTLPTLNPLQNPNKPENPFEISDNSFQSNTEKSKLSYYLHKWKYYFPRYWNEENEKEMRLLRNYDRRIIWLYSLLFLLIFNLDYIFLMILTINFRQNTSSLTTSIGLFVLFLIVTTVFRIAMKGIGSILDSMKPKSISMYFIAEVASLLFYYTFYRIIFRSIDNFFEFFLFQLFHLSSEWFLYVIRTSYTFFLYTEWFILTYCQDWFFIQKVRFSFHDWQRFMTLDFSIRFVVLLSSTYAIILLFVTIQYIPWIHSDLQQNSNDDDNSNASFEFTLLLLGLALVIEVINAWIMNEYYFKPNHLLIDKEIRSCYDNISFGMITLFIGVNLCINPVFAFTNDNTI